MFTVLQLPSNVVILLNRYRGNEFDNRGGVETIILTAIDILKDWAFWSSLESLRELLQPLDEALKMSEAGGSHLGHVWPAIVSLKCSEASGFEIYLIM